MVTCPHCGVEVTEANQRPSDIHRRHQCRECANKLRRKYYRLHLKEEREYDLKWRRNNRERMLKTKAHGYAKLRSEVFLHYSKDTFKCARCGFSDERALSIDHINGGGRQHIKKLGSQGKNFYLWLRKNNYPEGFQVLCMNCQFIKRHENHEVRLT